MGKRSGQFWELGIGQFLAPPPSTLTTTCVTLSCGTLMTTGNSRSGSVMRISFSVSLSFKVFATKRFCHKSLIACRFCVRVSSSVYRFMLNVYSVTPTLDCVFQQVQITTFFISCMFSLHILVESLKTQRIEEAQIQLFRLSFSFACEHNTRFWITVIIFEVDWIIKITYSSNFYYQVAINEKKNFRNIIGDKM